MSFRICHGGLAAIVWLVLLAGSAMAAELWIGRWAIDPQGCRIEGDTSETAPLYATKTSLKWFVASCKIGRMYKTGETVHIQARCSAEGVTSATPITLRPKGDRMAVTWDGSPVEEMRRCR
jgi:hypothetical protein